MAIETAEIAPATPPTPQVAKTTPDALTQTLYAKADKELEKLVDELFKPLLKYKQGDDPRIPLDHADPTKVGFNGYAKATAGQVWPPSIISAAWDSVYYGARDKFREKYVADFIAKVDSLQDQINDLSDAIRYQ